MLIDKRNDMLKEMLNDKRKKKCLLVCCAYHIEKQGCHYKKTVRLQKSNLGAMKKVGIESRCTLWILHS